MRSPPAVKVRPEFGSVLTLHPFVLGWVNWHLPARGASRASLALGRTHYGKTNPLRWWAGTEIWNKTLSLGRWLRSLDRDGGMIRHKGYEVSELDTRYNPCVISGDSVDSFAGAMSTVPTCLQGGVRSEVMLWRSCTHFIR